MASSDMTTDGDTSTAWLESEEGGDEGEDFGACANPRVFVSDNQVDAWKSAATATAEATSRREERSARRSDLVASMVRSQQFVPSSRAPPPDSERSSAYPAEEIVVKPPMVSAPPAPVPPYAASSASVPVPHLTSRRTATLLKEPAVHHKDYDDVSEAAASDRRRRHKSAPSAEEREDRDWKKRRDIEVQVAERAMEMRRKRQRGLYFTFLRMLAAGMETVGTGMGVEVMEGFSAAIVEAIDDDQFTSYADEIANGSGTGFGILDKPVSGSFMLMAMIAVNHFLASEKARKKQQRQKRKDSRRPRVRVHSATSPSSTSSSSSSSASSRRSHSSSSKSSSSRSHRSSHSRSKKRDDSAPRVIPLTDPRFTRAHPDAAAVSMHRPITANPGPDISTIRPLLDTAVDHVRQSNEEVKDKRELAALERQLPTFDSLDDVSEEVDDEDSESN